MTKNPEFISLMLKKAYQKDNPIRPMFLTFEVKRDHISKQPTFLDVDINEIEEITKGIQQRIK